MQKNGSVLNRLQLTFARFHFLSYYTYLVFFFGFYKATVMSSLETKVGQWLFHLKDTTVFCVVLLLSFIARFVISIWI